VRSRRKYLERIRVENPLLFHKILLYHGLAVPAASPPPTEVLGFPAADPDSSFTDSMSANRNRRREGKSKPA
jgi:hypothetical protein